MATRNSRLRRVISRILLVLLVIVLVYLALGLGFHVMWKSELEACTQERMARGEFVEHEVFWAPLALALSLIHI
mgnify:CR=1 FL=1